MAVLAIVGFIHRTLLLLRFRTELTTLAAARPALIVVQLFPLEIYRAHFAAALWLLQQTPPIPHIIIEAVLLLATWPIGVAQCLCAMNGVISIVTACLLCSLVRHATCSPAMGLVASLWFLLSTDLVILEYVFLGQAFYENLGMCLVTACIALMPSVMVGRNSARRAGLAGLLAALAALSRSSLSYFAIVPALALLPMARTRPVLLAAYLAPVLLLQGGWAIKNRIIYGDFAWETSSWGGFSEAKSLMERGELERLCGDILTRGPKTYPSWFLATARACPPPFFATFDNDMPAHIQARDEAARTLLGGLDLPLNSLAARLRSTQYQRAYARFIVSHPLIWARRFAAAYDVLWQRIGDYGARFVAPLFVTPVHRSWPDLWSRGFGEATHVMLSRPVVAFVPVVADSRAAFFGTISLAPLDALSILVLHAIFPVLAAVDLWRRCGRRPALLAPVLWMLAGAVGYGLLVFIAVEIKENMRFRLAIEPAIIALTFGCLSVVIRWARTAARPGRPITPQPASTP